MVLEKQIFKLLQASIFYSISKSCDDAVLVDRVIDIDQFLFLFSYSTDPEKCPRTAPRLTVRDSANTLN